MLAWCHVVSSVACVFATVVFGWCLTGKEKSTTTKEKCRRFEAALERRAVSFALTSAASRRGARVCVSVCCDLCGTIWVHGSSVWGCGRAHFASASPWPRLIADAICLSVDGSAVGTLCFVFINKSFHRLSVCP